MESVSVTNVFALWWSWSVCAMWLTLNYFVSPPPPSAGALVWWCTYCWVACHRSWTRAWKRRVLTSYARTSVSLVTTLRVSHRRRKITSASYLCRTWSEFPLKLSICSYDTQLLNLFFGIYRWKIRPILSLSLFHQTNIFIYSIQFNFALAVNWYMADLAYRSCMSLLLKLLTCLYLHRKSLRYVITIAKFVCLLCYYLRSLRPSAQSSMDHAWIKKAVGSRMSSSHVKPIATARLADFIERRKHQVALRTVSLAFWNMDRIVGQLQGLGIHIENTILQSR